MPGTGSCIKRCVSLRILRGNTDIADGRRYSCATVTTAGKQNNTDVRRLRCYRHHLSICINAMIHTLHTRRGVACYYRFSRAPTTSLLLLTVGGFFSAGDEWLGGGRGLLSSTAITQKTHVKASLFHDDRGISREENASVRFTGRHYGVENPSVIKQRLLNQKNTPSFFRLLCNRK